MSIPAMTVSLNEGKSPLSAMEKHDGLDFQKSERSVTSGIVNIDAGNSSRSSFGMQPSYPITRARAGFVGTDDEETSFRSLVNDVPTWLLWLGGGVLSSLLLRRVYLLSTMDSKRYPLFHAAILDILAQKDCTKEELLRDVENHISLKMWVGAPPGLRARFRFHYEPSLFLSMIRWIHSSPKYAKQNLFTDFSVLRTRINSGSLEVSPQDCAREATEVNVFSALFHLMNIEKVGFYLRDRVTKARIEINASNAFSEGFEHVYHLIHDGGQEDNIQKEARETAFSLFLQPAPSS